MRKDQKHFSYVILEFLPLYYTLNKNAFFFRLSDSNQNQLRKLQCLYVDLEYIILRAIRVNKLNAHRKSPAFFNGENLFWKTLALTRCLSVIANRQLP